MVDVQKHNEAADRLTMEAAARRGLIGAGLHRVMTTNGDCTCIVDEFRPLIDAKVADVIRVRAEEAKRVRLQAIDAAVDEALEEARNAGVAVLANYEHATANNGRQIEIQHVMDKLTDAIRALKP